MDMEKVDNRPVITADVLKTLSNLADTALKKQLKAVENLPPKLAAIRDKIDSGYYDSGEGKKNIIGKISQNLIDSADNEEYEEE